MPLATPTDRVKETSITTGTGAYTLSGDAVVAFQKLPDSFDGKTWEYVAENGTDWEVFTGTFTLVGRLLSRDTILASSNAGAAVNWPAGTKNISMTRPALFDSASLRASLTDPVGTGSVVFGGGADPSGSVGLLAVVGEADTFLRSDGSPALSQAIEPTMTGAWVWTAAAAPITITQGVATSGSPTALTVTGGAHTTLAASTEASDVTFNLARTVQFDAGALITQRAVRIQAPTYAFVGASTITNAATVQITGWPKEGTNATITNNFMLSLVADEDVGVAHASAWGGLYIRSGISGGGYGIGLQVDSPAATTLLRTSNNTVHFISDAFYFGSSHLNITGTRGLNFDGYVQIARDASGHVVHKSLAATYTPIITRGAVSQSANLQEWQDSAGTANAYVTAAGWINHPGHPRLTADVTNATATMSNLTDLAVTLIAGRKYTFKCILLLADSTAADGAKVDLDGGTATMTSFRAHGNASDDTAVVKLGQTSAIGTDLSQATVTGDAMFEIHGAFECNAGGTFIPRFARVGAIGGTVTVYKNSFLTVEESNA